MPRRILFWSTAPDLVGRQLSNFWPCRLLDPTFLPEKKVFHRSAEHAYFFHHGFFPQRLKYLR